MCLNGVTSLERYTKAPGINTGSNKDGGFVDRGIHACANFSGIVLAKGLE
jgi:hypothetical protein